MQYWILFYFFTEQAFRINFCPNCGCGRRKFCDFRSFKTSVTVLFAAFSESWCLRTLLLKRWMKTERTLFILLQNREDYPPMPLGSGSPAFPETKLTHHAYIPSFASLLFANISQQMALHVVICRFSLKFSYFMKRIKNFRYLTYVLSWKEKVLIHSELEIKWV